MTTYLKRTDPTVDAIITAAFPCFTGQDIAAEVQDTVRFTGTEWDEGNKRDYAVVRLWDRKVERIPSECYGDPSAFHRSSHTIPQGFVVVCWARYGLRQNIRIMGPAANITPMLAAPVELTADERLVLVATRSRKSSYAGVKNYRFVEARRAKGITLERWESAKASMITRGFLNRAGAITVEGRNAVGNEQL